MTAALAALTRELNRRPDIPVRTVALSPPPWGLSACRTRHRLLGGVMGILAPSASVGGGFGHALRQLPHWRGWRSSRSLCSS